MSNAIMSDALVPSFAGSSPDTLAGAVMPRTARNNRSQPSKTNLFEAGGMGGLSDATLFRSSAPEAEKGPSVQTEAPPVSFDVEFRTSNAVELHYLPEDGSGPVVVAKKNRQRVKEGQTDVATVRREVTAPEVLEQPLKGDFALWIVDKDNKDGGYYVSSTAPTLNGEDASSTRRIRKDDKAAMTVIAMDEFGDGKVSGIDPNTGKFNGVGDKSYDDVIITIQEDITEGGTAAEVPRSGPFLLAPGFALNGGRINGMVDLNVTLKGEDELVLDAFDPVKQRWVEVARKDEGDDSVEKTVTLRRRGGTLPATRLRNLSNGDVIIHSNNSRNARETSDDGSSVKLTFGAESTKGTVDIKAEFDAAPAEVLYDNIVGEGMTVEGNLQVAGDAGEKEEEPGPFVLKSATLRYDILNGPTADPVRLEYYDVKEKKWKMIGGKKAGNGSKTIAGLGRERTDIELPITNGEPPRLRMVNGRHGNATTLTPRLTKYGLIYSVTTTNLETNKTPGSKEPRMQINRVSPFDGGMSLVWADGGAGQSGNSERPNISVLLKTTFDPKSYPRVPDTDRPIESIDIKVDINSEASNDEISASYLDPETGKWKVIAEKGKGKQKAGKSLAEAERKTFTVPVVDGKVPLIALENRSVEAVTIGEPRLDDDGVVRFNFLNELTPQKGGRGADALVLNGSRGVMGRPKVRSQETDGRTTTISWADGGTTQSTNNEERGNITLSATTNFKKADSLTDSDFGTPKPPNDAQFLEDMKDRGLAYDGLPGVSSKTAARALVALNDGEISDTVYEGLVDKGIIAVDEDAGEWSLDLKKVPQEFLSSILGRIFSAYSLGPAARLETVKELGLDNADIGLLVDSFSSDADGIPSGEDMLQTNSLDPFISVDEDGYLKIDRAGLAELPDYAELIGGVDLTGTESEIVADIESTKSPALLDLDDPKVATSLADALDGVIGLAEDLVGKQKIIDALAPQIERQISNARRIVRLLPSGNYKFEPSLDLSFANSNLGDVIGEGALKALSQTRIGLAFTLSNFGEEIELKDLTVFFRMWGDFGWGIDDTKHFASLGPAYQNVYNFKVPIKRTEDGVFVSGGDPELGLFSGVTLNGVIMAPTVARGAMLLVKKAGSVIADTLPFQAVRNTERAITSALSNTMNLLRTVTGNGRNNRLLPMTNADGVSLADALSSVESTPGVARRLWENLKTKSDVNIRGGIGLVGNINIGKLARESEHAVATMILLGGVGAIAHAFGPVVATAFLAQVFLRHRNSERMRALRTYASLGGTVTGALSIGTMAAYAYAKGALKNVVLGGYGYISPRPFGNLRGPWDIPDVKEDADQPTTAVNYGRFRLQNQITGGLVLWPREGHGPLPDNVPEPGPQPEEPDEDDFPSLDSFVPTSEPAAESSPVIGPEPEASGSLKPPELDPEPEASASLLDPEPEASGSLKPPELDPEPKSNFVGR